ncbi:MAG TPA: hypothetical protein VMB27_18130 [Solirubrobacteraceae bacterium]|nr:hypothetical protein [Solirubrobacteraceae bacterium]
MASLPRPLIALLVATLAAFGLWYVELRPSSSSSGGGSQGVGSYQSAINKAHQAVKTSNAANAKLGAPTSTGKAAASPTPAKTTVAAKTSTAPPKTTVVASKASAADTAKPTVKHVAAKPTAKSVSAAQELSLVTNAIAAHKVVAVLFYNDAAADDQAVDHELAAVPTHGGKVVKAAVPLSRLTSFGIITQQIPVVTAPTLVLIDSTRQATEITGFADTLEITQRVDDALAGN